jgi:hypothetical protein
MLPVTRLQIIANVQIRNKPHPKSASKKSTFISPGYGDCLLYPQLNPSSSLQSKLKLHRWTGTRNSVSPSVNAHFRFPTHPHLPYKPHHQSKQAGTERVRGLVSRAAACSPAMAGAGWRRYLTDRGSNARRPIASPNRQRHRPHRVESSVQRVIRLRSQDCTQRQPCDAQGPSPAAPFCCLRFPPGVTPHSPAGALLCLLFAD